MSRSSKFPNVEEFRARAAKLGFSTGVAPGRSEPAPKLKRKSADARALLLWGSLGLIAVSLLGWLVVEQGGPAQFVEALGLDKPAFMMRETAITALQSPNRGASNTDLREITTLRQRLNTLERRRAAQTRTSNKQIFQNAPIQTGSLPTPRVIQPGPTPQTGAKQDAPKQSSGRAPTSVSALPLPSATGSLPGARPAPFAGGSRNNPASQLRFGLDLGGFATLPELATMWRTVQNGNADLLAGLRPRQVTEFSASGARAFRLIAGPIDKIATAVQLCEIFRARGISCRQTISAGAPL